MNYLNKTIGLVVMLAMMGVSSGVAQAEGGHGRKEHPRKDRLAAPGIEKRMENQKKRIEHKLEKGKITQDEANKLNQNVDAVAAKRTELSADGKLTKEERKDLHQDLRDSGKEIKNTVKAPEMPKAPEAH